MRASRNRVVAVAVVVLALGNEHVAAARIFEGVLAKDPDNVLALKFLGGRALEIGDLARAVDLNERVVKSGLHVADAMSNLVLTFDRLNRRDEALAIADRALGVDPDHVAARCNRAVVLAAAGRTADAARDLESVPVDARFADLVRRVAIPLTH